MLRPRYLFALLLAGAIMTAACLPENDPADPSANPLILGIDGVTVLNCPALPAASTSAVIGKNGGSITVGPHRIDVPRGALSSDVLITASIDGTTAVAIRLLPEGLRFNKGPAATLTMSYAHCPPVGLLSLKMLYVSDDLLKILESIPLITSSSANTISGKLKHFSRYAVAY